jgi:hypothetical protein
MLSASMLAIDVGMFMNARAQAQNAADAGAHAGATALAFNSFTIIPPTAGREGCDQRGTNESRGGCAPSVLPEDVTFPVQRHHGSVRSGAGARLRTGARGNPWTH